MSKSVKIPNIGADPLIITIGNDSYTYQAGETYTVPDNVAEVLTNLVNSFPKEGTPNVPVIAPKPAVADAGKVLGVDEDGNYALTEGGAEIPTPAVADAGKVLGVDEDGDYALVEGGGSPETVTFTVPQNDATINSGYTNLVEIETQCPSGKYIVRSAYAREIENKEEMDLCYYGGLVCPYFEVVDGYAEIYLYTPLDEDVVLYEIYIQAIKVAD